MAAPQTHGLVSFAILAVFLLLAALGLTTGITFWEFVSTIIWGVLFDFCDHFTSWSYLKDIPARIKRGGGMPAKDVKIPISWMHLWPGFCLVWVWGFGFNFFDSSFRCYLPFIFWATHVVIDRFQKNLDYDPHRSFWYPIIKKTYIPKQGYPIKPPAEFIISSGIWMIISFLLLGLYLYR